MFHATQTSFMNFTQVNQLNYGANLAPRKSFCENNKCLTLIDTALEREMSLGTTYPFDPLSEGECLQPPNMDTTILEIPMWTMLNDIVAVYN